MVLLKKGQVEVIGLVLIVIVLVLLFVLFLYFKAGGREDSKDDRYLELQANSLRISLLQTTLCEDVSVKEELISCSSEFSLCGECSESLDDVKDILENSIPENVGYVFSIDPGDIELRRGNCVEKVTAVDQPLGRGLTANLGICFL